MSTVFVRHPVADYKAWRPHFDGDTARRTAAGLKDLGVYQNANDPHDVLIMFDAKDRSGVDQMLESDGLKKTMKEAGVTGPPKAWVAE